MACSDLHSVHFAKIPDLAQLGHDYRRTGGKVANHVDGDHLVGDEADLLVMGSD